MLLPSHRSEYVCECRLFKRKFNTESDLFAHHFSQISPIVRCWDGLDEPDGGWLKVESV